MSLDIKKKEAVPKEERLPFPIPLPIRDGLTGLSQTLKARKGYSIFSYQAVSGVTVALKYVCGLLDGAWLSNESAIERDILDEEITERFVSFCNCPNIRSLDVNFSGWVYGKVGMASYTADKIREILTKDFQESYQDKLSFIAHGGNKGIMLEPFESADEEFSWLKSIGVTVAKSQTKLGVFSLARIKSVIFEYEYEDEPNPLDVIGVVFGFDDQGGGQVLYAFDSPLKSVVRDIEWKTLCRGLVVPVVAIDAVGMNGKVYWEAKFRNCFDFKALDLCRGDIISLEQGRFSRIVVGKVLKKSETHGPYVEPVFCPSCFVELCDLRCRNRRCKPILEHDIKRYCRVLNIPIGSKQLETLVRDGTVSDVSDIYYLSQKDMVGLFGDKAREVFEKIMIAGEVTGVDFLDALGVSGRQLSQKILSFVTFQEILNDKEDLVYPPEVMARKHLSAKVVGADKFFEKFRFAKSTIERLMKCVDIKSPTLEENE